jgi:hypothetical protein
MLYRILISSIIITSHNMYTPLVTHLPAHWLSGMGQGDEDGRYQPGIVEGEQLFFELGRFAVNVVEAEGNLIFWGAEY